MMMTKIREQVIIGTAISFADLQISKHVSDMIYSIFVIRFLVMDYPLIHLVFYRQSVRSFSRDPRSNFYEFYLCPWILNILLKKSSIKVISDMKIWTIEYMYIRTREKDEIKNDYIFRFDELYIVFAFLKVMAVVLDQTLVELDVR